ncbi:MAG: ComEC/Rec2 family competence protein [Treponema sp.]|nr:ComEC/Rec2 family competence protein [Treponema sp.]
MQIKPKSKTKFCINPPMPSLYSALGMAAAFYALPFIYSFILVLLILFAVIVSVFRALPQGGAVGGPVGTGGGALPWGGPVGTGGLLVRKAGIIAAALAIGFSLGIAARRSIPAEAEFGIPAENISSIRGILLEDPRTLQGGSGISALELLASGSGPNEGLRVSSRGRITVFFPPDSIPRLREFGRGSEVFLEGSIRTGDRGPVFSASSVHIMKSASPLQTFRTGLRIAIIEAFGNYGGTGRGQGGADWTGLASALVLGVRDDLDVNLSDGFRDAGASYVLALSGMHLAIISGALAFLIRRPLGIRGASIVGALFVLVYIFIAGPQPSLVRSGIMYFIGVIAILGLLKRDSLSILCFAFIIQLIFQSETGLSLSFIFSYLALFGILTLGQVIRSLFKGYLPDILNNSLSASLGAFIVTAPVILFYFGSLRPIGIIAGPIIALIASPFIILSIVALPGGFTPLLPIFDFILDKIYSLIVITVNLAAGVPGIRISNPLPGLLCSALLCLLLYFVEWKINLYRNRIESFN